MKKVGMIAGMAGLATIASVMCVPALADSWTPNDREPVRDYQYATTAVTSVPEPATMALLALGLGGLGMMPRRRKKS